MIVARYKNNIMVKASSTKKKNKLGVKNSLVNNINAKKKKGTSRPKKKSTISKESYADMQNNWGKKSAAKKKSAKKSSSKKAAKKSSAKKKSASKKTTTKRKSAVKKSSSKKRSAKKG